MTGLLLELEQKRQERFPTDAFPTDHWAWNGDETIRFAEIIKFGREYAASLRGLRDSNPTDEALKQGRQKALELGRQMLAHLSARRKALMESWQPSGPAN